MTIDIILPIITLNENHFLAILYYCITAMFIGLGYITELLDNPVWVGFTLFVAFIATMELAIGEHWLRFIFI